ncbi:hypothetical protein BGZ83_006300 [Gryganskiella cystojenkinii]|nr:hypothetical protein BGZ83_006300 [Gryganskiella cystojenkinii]
MSCSTAPPLPPLDIATISIPWDDNDSDDGLPTPSEIFPLLQNTPPASPSPSSSISKAAASPLSVTTSGWIRVGAKVFICLGTASLAFTVIAGAGLPVTIAIPFLGASLNVHALLSGLQAAGLALAFFDILFPMIVAGLRTLKSWHRACYMPGFAFRKTFSFHLKQFQAHLTQQTLQAQQQITADQWQHILNLNSYRQDQAMANRTILDLQERLFKLERREQERQQKHTSY